MNHTMNCIATFYSHFGAIRFKKQCDVCGWPANMMPVPRSLSSSCGTCVRFAAGGGQDFIPPGAVMDEIEQIAEAAPEGYRKLYASAD